MQPAAGPPWAQVQGQHKLCLPAAPTWPASCCPGTHGVSLRQQGGAPRVPTCLQATSTRSGTTSPPPRDTHSTAPVSLSTNSVVLLPPRLNTSQVKHTSDTQRHAATDIQTQLQRQLSSQEPGLPSWLDFQLPSSPSHHEEDAQVDVAELWGFTTSPQVPAPQPPQSQDTAVGDLDDHHVTSLPLPTPRDSTTASTTEAHNEVQPTHTRPKRTRRRAATHTGAHVVPTQPTHVVPTQPTHTTSNQDQQQPHHLPANTAHHVIDANGFPVNKGRAVPHIADPPAAHLVNTAHVLLLPPEPQLVSGNHAATPPAATTHHVQTPSAHLPLSAPPDLPTHSPAPRKSRDNHVTRQLDSAGSVHELAARVSKLGSGMEADHISAAVTRLAALLCDATQQQQEGADLSPVPPPSPPAQAAQAVASASHAYTPHSPLQLLPPPDLPTSPPAQAAVGSERQSVNKAPQPTAAARPTTTSMPAVRDLAAAGRLLTQLLHLCTRVLPAAHPSHAISTLTALAKLHHANLVTSCLQAANTTAATSTAGSGSHHVSSTTLPHLGLVLPGQQVSPASYLLPAVQHAYPVSHPDHTHSSYESHFRDVCTALAESAAVAVSQPSVYRLRSTLYCNLAWSAAVLQLGDVVPDLWPALLAALPRQVKHMSARDACGTAWAVVKSQQYDQGLFDLLLDRVGELVRRFVGLGCQVDVGSEGAHSVVTQKQQQVRRQHQASGTQSSGHGFDTDTGMIRQRGSCSRREVYRSQHRAEALDTGHPAQQLPESMQGQQTQPEQTPLQQAPLQQAPLQQAPLQQAPLPQAPLNQTPQGQAGRQQAQQETSPERSKTMRWQLSSDTKAGLSCEDMSQLVWSFSRVSHPLDQLLPDLEVVGLQLLHSMTPQHMANIAWGMAAQRLRAPRLSAAIFRRAAGCLDQLEINHIAQLAWAAAKQRNHTQLHTAHDAATDWPTNSQPDSSSDLSETGTALSETQLLAAFAPVVATRLGEVSGQDAVLLAWAYAHTGLLAQPLLTSLGQVLKGRLGECDHKGLATLLWAYVKQRVWDEVLYDSLLTALSHQPLEQVHAGCCHMAVWALGHLAEGGPAPEGIPAGRHLVDRHKQLSQRLVTILHSQLHRCSGQELSNLAWACAQLGVYQPGMFEDIASCVISTRYPSAMRHNTSNHHHHHRNSSADAAADSQHLSQQQQYHVARGHVTGHGQQLPAADSASQRLQGGDRAARQASCGVSRVRSVGWAVVDQLKALECSKLVWAFAQVGHVHEQLFQSISGRMCHLVDTAGPRSVRTMPIGAAARTLWSFAQQGMYDDLVLGRLLACARAALDLAQPRDIAAVMWALAAAGRMEDDVQLTTSCIAYAARHARFFRGYHLADVMWALGTAVSGSSARVDHVCELAAPLLDHVLLRLQHAPHTFRVSELSTIMWSLVQLQRDEQHLAVHVADHVAHMMQTQQRQRLKTSKSTLHSRRAWHQLAASVSTTKFAHTAASGAIHHSSLSTARPGVQALMQQSRAARVQGSRDRAQGWQPQDLVLLLHSLASFGHFHPSLFSQAAQALLHDLDVLDTENLVLLVWSVACTLHQATGEVQAWCCSLLSAAGDMLQQVAPPTRPTALTPEELQLLWQSHQCCQIWAAHAAHSFSEARSVMSLPPSLLHHTTRDAPINGMLCCCGGLPHHHHQLGQSAHHVLATTTTTTCPGAPPPLPPPPFRLQPELVAHVAQASSVPSKIAQSEVLSELIRCLDGMGLSLAAASQQQAVVEVMAGCGHHWLAASLGDRQLVIVLTRDPVSLKGTHMVTCRLLDHLGHVMMLLPLRQWSRLKTAQGRRLYLERSIAQAVGAGRQTTQVKHRTYTESTGTAAGG